MILMFALSPTAQAGSLPGNDPAHGDTVTCGPTADYSCTGGGYSQSNAESSGWPWSQFGGQWPSYDSAGRPHNCTLYVAYRLLQNGMASGLLSAYGHGGQWDAGQWHNWVPANGNPAVGSVAEWSGGHVAYVESVSSAGIVISDDNEGYNYTTTQSIAWDSTHWPDWFLHIQDVGPQWTSSSSVNGYANHIVQWTDGTAWLVGPDLHRRWIKDGRTYNCLTARGVPVSGVLDSATLNALADLTGVRAQCPAGDINTDGTVNIFDLSILISNYGMSTANAGYNGNSDINDDGSTDITDLSIMLSHWGERG